jgi:hypothetical protein
VAISLSDYSSSAGSGSTLAIQMTSIGVVKNHLEHGTNSAIAVFATGGAHS